jgi:cytochrome c1
MTGGGIMTSRASLRKTASGFVLAAALFATGLPAAAAEGGPEIAAQSWSFSGPFGTFDRAQLQRGYKVYKQICSACHGMRQLHFRNLGQPGGPEFPEAAVKALAAEAEVQDGPNDEGEMFTRPGRPADAFPSPFPNKQAARVANNGALPPDLSVIAKARAGGPDYLYALLAGYADPPEDMELAEGMNYNKAFPGHQIAMAPPLFEEAVEYTDGTAPTLENHAKDVAAFLMWAAEPKLEERLKIGFRFMIYIVLLTAFLYIAKRRVWAGLKH